MAAKILVFCALFTALLASSCKKDSHDEKKSPALALTEPDPVPDYSQEKMWLCLPGKEDICSQEPQSNELLSNGTFAPVTETAPPEDAVDCFFVHGTSDLSVKAGNTQNFDYLEPVQRLALMQAAPFRSVCKIYAPQYREMTIGTYALSEEDRKPYTDIAADDILRAFDFYMAHFNKGRKIVFIGHSQGSEMLSLVLKARFDEVPEMRSQLLIALLPGFAVHVPIDAPVGSTFKNIPACTTAGEVGCVVAFRSFKKGTVYLGDGTIKLLDREEELCVNPATLDNPDLSVEDRRKTTANLSGTLLPPSAWVSDSIRLTDAPTPFVLTRGTYSATCVSGPDARNRYLSIDEVLPDSDPRHGLVLLDSKELTGITGLHVLDMQFPMAELIALVRARR